jgi:CheY-like chemotaxis protein
MNADSDVKHTILSGWKILVVDDDAFSLRVAKTILSFYGAQIYVATNGEEGLQVVRNVTPHFIISDLSMPVMDGWTMIKTLKQERTTQDIPIIALTAHAMVGDREKAIAVGCHNYLTKPLTPATFIKDLLSLLLDIPTLAQKLNLDGG